MENQKIAWDDGHGVGQDRGAEGIVNEESVIKAISDVAIAKLRSLGREVLRVRPASASNVDNSLAQRCAAADDWGADIYVAEHANIGGGRGTGIEIYTNNADKLPEAQRCLQVMLQEGFHIHSGTPTDVNSGIKDGSHYYVIAGTKMKAMLIESFFIDNQSDVDFYKGHIESFANAIVYGITGVDLRRTIAQPPVMDKQFPIHMFAHIENIGNTQVDGINDVTIGTVGQSLRVEALSINIDGVDLTYTVHAQDIGNIVGQAEGQIEGTMGVAKRIEAITINVSSIPQGYKLQYQAHIQDRGWTVWKESGQIAGTIGESLRLEALRIRIVKM